MSAGVENPLTRLLAAASVGDQAAQEQLWRAVYDELRRVAHRQMSAEPGGCELQTTVLVHEAYLRLVGDGHMDWNSAGHFFAAAAQAMRRIRVDYARSSRSAKRGGGRRAVGACDELSAGEENLDAAELLTLDESLQRLEQEAPRAAQVVMLRYFAGLNVDAVARILDVSPRTVELDWWFARAWLRRELTSK
ncbi:MAG: sigma-70 family RNA polymerase sigma factor [Phycisphaerae bacterium]|nr:sigma-70 family RNA polymerase sigma factor [Phycisphaerae bacterium]